MSADKKRTRQQFRDAVFDRDKGRCRACGWSVFSAELQLDAHHITDRHLMPNGGYVASNGIALCPGCHEKAEVFHSTGEALPGWSPDDLYALIGSSHERATRDAERLR